MYNYPNILLIIFPIILGSLTSCTKNHLSDTKKTKNSFNNVIISCYTNVQFDKVNIEKKIEDKVNIKYSEDNKKIVSDFLKYLKQLQIEEIKPTDIPDTVPLQELYEINFTDKETYSKLKIEVLNEKYIKVINYIYKKVKNKEKNITSYEETVNSATYKIHNIELNLNYIKNIFNALNVKNDSNSRSH